MWKFGVFVCLTLVANQISYVISTHCKIYSCGKIDHSGETAENWSCVKSQNTSQHKVPTEVCPIGYVCEANLAEFNLTKSKYFCINKEQITPSGTVLPGDVCTSNSQCYNNAGGAICLNGSCSPKVKISEDCRQGRAYPVADSSKCPVGSYCNSSFICASTIKEGDKCGLFDSCSTGLTCIGKENEFQGTCQRMFGAEIGTKFSVNSFNVNSIVGPNSYCKTYSYFKLSDFKYECRPGDLSYDQTEEELKRNDPSILCSYTTWNHQNATSNTPIYKNDTALCGYNVDGFYCCNKRIGDNWFQSTLNKLKTIDITKFKCHAESNILDCYDFIKNLNQQLYSELRQKLYEIKNGGYAKIANNDKCVAKSITNQYWQDQKPKSKESNILSFFSS